MKQYEVLNESINFATKQLEDFNAEKKLNNTSDIVITALYRKIIELSVGVKVASENGLSGPVVLNYRGLVEAYLAFMYILQKDSLLEDRAKAYKVGYHKQLIEEGEYALKKYSDTIDKQSLESAIQYHKIELEKSDLQEILTEYNKLQNQNKGNYIPKWYSLNNGPKSINMLAKILETEGEGKDRKLFAQLYSFLSKGAHNYTALSSIIENDTGFSIEPVQASFNMDTDKNKFMLARSMLTFAALKFTVNTFPEYEGNLSSFIKWISPYLNSN